MTLGRDLALRDALDQAALVQRGDLTAQELVEAAIERIEALEASVNAVLTPMFEQGRAAARQVDTSAPLAGVPFLLKDLAAEYAGVRMTEGSRFLADHVSTVDTELVVRQKRAGLVHLGKTTAPEFGMGADAGLGLCGTVRNPWHLARTPGGSSSGSAAAVAARLTPLAHGNDLFGSLRVPAAYCGLFALVPTRARNPWGPLYGDVGSGWAVENGLSVSVRDSAALLDATRGADLGAPYVAPEPRGSYLDAVSRPPRRLRIGVSLAHPDGSPWHPEVTAAVRDAADELARLGHDVVEAAPPGVGGQEWNDTTLTVLGGTVAWTRAHWVRRIGREPRPDELAPGTRMLFELAAEIRAGDYLASIEALQGVARRVAGWHESFDLWLQPTVGCPAPELGADAGTEEDPLAGFFRVGWPSPPITVTNICGSPGMNLPVGHATDGTALGVHLSAAYAGEDLLFSVAGQWEQTRPWADRVPPLVADWLEEG